jgi:hypothetical protein
MSVGAINSTMQLISESVCAVMHLGAAMQCEYEDLLSVSSIGVALKKERNS